MKKKEYIKPEQRVVVLQHQQHLLTGSEVRSLSMNMDDDEDDFIFGGGGNGDVR